MDSRAETLIRHGDQLFGKRLSLLSLWQEIADNFYPLRADFTASRSLGDDFASNLTTSYPLIAHRELSDAFSTMLRPKSQEWFHIGVIRDDRVDNEGRRWLEWATGLQRRAMYDQVTRFVRASKEGDRDFAAFGQCVKSAELNRAGEALLYRCWHPRDVAWCERYEGSVGTVHRKWQPTAQSLASEFRGKVASKVIESLDKDPYCTVNCRHVVIPSDEYDAPSSKTEYESIKPGVRKWKTPYVSVYIDVDNQHVMEESPTFNRIYTIPRWQTVTGSQYAYSPAAITALPDARLIQAMTLTLLEAGEKAVDPPIVAKHEILRSDMNVFAGGLTYVDLEEDERIQDVMQFMVNDKSGIPLGMEMRQEAKNMIAEAFYLNKLNMPIPQGEGTAYEISKLLQEYIRNALPLFEPMETEDNAAICEQTFDILLRAGAFGSPEDMPQSLRGQEIQFTFDNPLNEAAEKQKGQTFMQTKALLAEAAALDPGSTAMVDARTALRDALTGIGVPAKWVRDEEQMKAIDLQQAQKRQAEEMIAMMQQGGAAAEQIGKAGQAIQGITA